MLDKITFHVDIQLNFMVVRSKVKDGKRLNKVCKVRKGYLVVNDSLGRRKR